jgi:cobaltochelatase CobT
VSAAPEKLATLKTAIAATTRALARKHNLHVEFGPGARAKSDKIEVSLPPMTELPSPDALSYTRGVADHAALNIRYHDTAIHRGLRPSGQTNARLFDMLETVRVEALGSQHMTGVRHNLYRRFEQEALQKERDKLPLLRSIELFARRHIQELPIPPFLSGNLDNAQEQFKSLQPLWEKMQKTISDQKQFASLALKLIDQLSHVTASLERGNDDEQTFNKESTVQETEEPSEKLQPQGPSPDMGESQPTTIAMTAGGTAGDGTQAGGEENTKSAPYPFNYSGIPESGHDYHPYTTQYDEVVIASALASPSELDFLRRQLEQRLSQFQNITARLASRLQRLLLAKQARRWTFDEEEGMIDSRKLPRVIIHPDYQEIYKREKDTEFRDTIVTLLIDNSGSMRGRPITMAALSADIISRTLERCGVKVEILGFTTKEWKGGNTYKQWVKSGKPARPGRLNDLRHIIYKSAEVSWRKSRRNLGLMLKDGILKENIDGEAIIWACERLLKRPEQRHILMVISDGAPVDDSTLSANGGNYLDRHLREVIAWVENELPVELVAIGIGHDVTRYYKRAVTISDIDKLGETMTEQLGQLFDTVD